MIAIGISQIFFTGRHFLRGRQVATAVNNTVFGISNGLIGLGSRRRGDVSVVGSEPCLIELPERRSALWRHQPRFDEFGIDCGGILRLPIEFRGRDHEQVDVAVRLVVTAGFRAEQDDSLHGPAARHSGHDGRDRIVVGLRQGKR